MTRPRFRIGPLEVGIGCLMLAYVLSQFYRAFLAVLSPVLDAEIGATPGDLATASGLWFLTFALMQIPVGAALDRIGPRLTTAAVLGVFGAGGAFVFAWASEPWHVAAAMALIGIGCSPVLMAAYVIFARAYPPALFATLAGVTVAVGNLGNIAAAAPLNWAVAALGWRGALVALGIATLAVAVAAGALVRDPPAPPAPEKGSGSVLDLLRMPVLWPILLLMLVSYAPTAAVRGLWAGPYARDILGADQATIGWITLAMGVAMILGNLVYGPADRLFGTRKWVIFAGNVASLAALAALAVLPRGIGTATALIAAVGFFGSAYPAIVAHFRAFVPAHLTGRGVTLINMASIGGAGLLQVATRPIYAGADSPEAAYRMIFGLFAGLLAAGILIYLTSRDRL